MSIEEVKKWYQINPVTLLTLISRSLNSLETNFKQNPMDEKRKYRFVSDFLQTHFRIRFITYKEFIIID